MNFFKLREILNEKHTTNLHTAARKIWEKGGGRYPPKVVGRKIRQKPRTWGSQLVISFSEYLNDTGRVPDTSSLFPPDLYLYVNFATKGILITFLDLGTLAYCIVGIL
jgi:hypothetical protein